MAEPLIAKRGRVVVETESGIRPATRKDLEGASLVADRGPLLIETPQGLEPATIGDARSAVGRVARGLVKNQVGGFSDRALASKAGRKARASETVKERRERGVRAGTAAAEKLNPAERAARARKGWATRRQTQDSE